MQKMLRLFRYVRTPLLQLQPMSLPQTSLTSAIAFSFGDVRLIVKTVGGLT